MADSRLRVVIDAVDNSKGATTSASANVKKLAADVGAAGRSFIALGAPLVALGALSVKTFGTFEQTMARVQAVSNATAVEFEDLNEVAREMGQTTVFTANQSAEALAFMAMAGLSAADAIGALPSVLQLAAAGGLELANAADIITNVMAGMGLEVEELARANDVLVTAFTNTNTNLQQLGQAFKFAGPVAKAAGLTFEDTAAALAQMGNAGIQATMAGTSLRGAVTRLLNPSKEAGKVLDELGINVFDAAGKMIPFVDIVRQFETVGLEAADAMTIFGLRAGPGMLALVSQGADALEELRDKMLESGGTAQRIADVQLATLQGQFTLLKSAVEGAALELGAALMPVLLDLIELLRPLVAGITDFIENNKRLAIIAVGLGVALVAVGAAMVGIGIIVPGLVTAFGLVAGAATAMWAAITLPVSAVILALAGLVTAFILWRDKFIEIAGLVARAFEMMFLPFLTGARKVLEVLNKFGIGFDASLISLEHWVEKGLTVVGETADDAVGKLKELVNALTGNTRAVKLSQTAFAKWSDVVSKAREEMEKSQGTAENLDGALDDLKDTVKELSDVVIANHSEWISLQARWVAAREDVLQLDVATGTLGEGMRTITGIVIQGKERLEELRRETALFALLIQREMIGTAELYAQGLISVAEAEKVAAFGQVKFKEAIEETTDALNSQIEVTNALIDATVRAVNISLNPGGQPAPIATRTGPDGRIQFLIPGFGWVTGATVGGGTVAAASIGVGTGGLSIGGPTLSSGVGGVTVNLNGPVFGFDDFEDRVVDATNRAARRGALDVGP